MNENTENDVSSPSIENSVSVEFQNEVNNSQMEDSSPGVPDDGSSSPQYFTTSGYSPIPAQHPPTPDSSYENHRGRGRFSSPNDSNYYTTDYFPTRNNGFYQPKGQSGYQYYGQGNFENYRYNYGYQGSNKTTMKRSHHVPSRSPTSTPPVSATSPIFLVEPLEVEEFKKNDIEKKLDMVFEKLTDLTSNINSILKTQTTLEDRIGKLDYWLSDTDIRANRLEYRLGGCERSSQHNSNSLHRCHQRLDELSFLQNNRIAKSLKFGYRKKVEENLERHLKIKVQFLPCKIYEASETFHHPRDCVKYLSPEFQIMRDFMNNLNTTSRSRLDKRKDTFLRLDSDHLFIPAISVDKDGKIVICRVTTSPLGFVNIQRLFRQFQSSGIIRGGEMNNGTTSSHKNNNRRYNNKWKGGGNKNNHSQSSGHGNNSNYKIHQFVQNAFYNLSVLEHQVAMVKNFEARVIRIVFLYETSVDTFGNTYHNSHPLVEFLKGYPMEFKCLNTLLKMKKLTMISMKEMDTSRVQL